MWEAADGLVYGFYRSVLTHLTGHAHNQVTGIHSSETAWVGQRCENSHQQVSQSSVSISTLSFISLLL